MKTLIQPTRSPPITLERSHNSNQGTCDICFFLAVSTRRKGRQADILSPRSLHTPREPVSEVKKGVRYRPSSEKFDPQPKSKSPRKYPPRMEEEMPSKPKPINARRGANQRCSFKHMNRTSRNKGEVDRFGRKWHVMNCASKPEETPERRSLDVDAGAIKQGRKGVGNKSGESKESTSSRIKFM